MLRARGVPPAAGRMRHPRRLRLADRAHLPRDGHRESHDPPQLDRIRGAGRPEHRPGPWRRLPRQRESQELRSEADGRRPGRIHARARLHPWLWLRGEQRSLHVSGARHGHAGLRLPVQENGARSRGSLHHDGRLRRGAAPLRELCRPRSRDEGPLGDPGAALPLPVQRQRAQDGRGHGRDRARDVRGGGDRGRGSRTRGPHGRVVHPRAGDGADGRRSQDVGTEPVSAVPRRAEPVRGGRFEPRERVVSESHLDDHGAGVALVRVPGGRIQKGEPVTDGTNHDAGGSSPESLSRRDMIAATAAALATPLLNAKAVTTSPARDLAPRFLTAAELALLAELTELIIPADDHSPGARAAGVAAYIDGRLAESLEPDWQERWRAGLHAVDGMSRERHGKPCLQATPDQRAALLTELAAGEQDPKTPLDHFFKELKRWTVRAYYTSRSASTSIRSTRATC